jgi:membrane protein required for colicin V production
MNWLDILILIPITWGAFKGLVKGLVAELLSIIGLIIGLFIANKFSGALAKALNWDSRFAGILAFMVIMMAVFVVVYLLTRVLNKTLDVVKMQWLNKLGGMLFGALKWALVFSIILYLWDLLDKTYPIFQGKAKQNSVLYPVVSEIGKTAGNLNFEPIQHFLNVQKKDSVQGQ